jgi:hypothetical protein
MEVDVGRLVLFSQEQRVANIVVPRPVRCGPHLAALVEDIRQLCTTLREALEPYVAVVLHSSDEAFE